MRSLLTLGDPSRTTELEDGVTSAAALLAIVSPAYQASNWCREERRFLLSHYGGLEGLNIGGIYRLFKIFKLPTERDLLAELQDVRFFHQGTKEPYLIESQEFKVAITKAVTAIRELFRLMSNGQTSIYLASGAIEMEADRNRLENELLPRGYKVRPNLALDESYGAETLVAEMEPCSRAIFLLGGVYDRFVEEQIDQAVALKKPCLFWIHPRFSSNAADEQEALLKRLHSRDLPAGSEILGQQSIPALWKDLEPKLKDSAEPKAAAVSESDKPRVYLIFDATLSAESEAASHLSGILNDRNLQVIPYQNYDDHPGLMGNSDAALVLRTTKPEALNDWWLSLFAQELIHSTRFAAKALVLADSIRLTQSAGDIPVLAYSQPFSPRALDPFVEKLQRAKGAHASR